MFANRYLWCAAILISISPACNDPDQLERRQRKTVAAGSNTADAQAEIDSLEQTEQTVAKQTQPVNDALADSAVEKAPEQDTTVLPPAVEDMPFEEVTDDTADSATPVNDDTQEDAEVVENPPDTPPVTPNPADINIQTSTPALTLLQNRSDTVDFMVTPVNGFAGPIAITAPANLPADVDVTFFDAQGNELVNNTFDVAANTPVTLTALISHAPQIANGTMAASQPLAVTQFDFAFSGAQAAVNKVSQLGIGLSKILVLEALDPAQNNGRMITPTRVEVPVGVGILYLNSFSDGLRMHGNPHQASGGMPMGMAYDKFGGGAPVSLDNAEAAQVCQQADDDTMYDHNNRNQSGDIVIACQ